MRAQFALKMMTLGRWAFFWLMLLGIAGCGKDASPEAPIGDLPEIGPADPPYLPAVVYPNGLQLDLIRDATLTGSYPNPGGNPFGARRDRHYARVVYFVDLTRAPVSQRVSANFQLSEYVNPTLNRGGTRAYVDVQIVDHVQQIRSGLGRPLILNSAFRSPLHNRSVGGATFSRHIYGDAADIDVDQGRPDASQRAQEIFNEARDVGVDFISPLSETSVAVDGDIRVSWIHMDDRGF